MTAGNFQWIGTDRKTEADILNEIAAAGAPVIIVSRDPLSEPMPRPLRQDCASATDLDLLQLVADETWPMLSQLPAELVALIQNPTRAGFLVISTSKARQRTAEGESATSIWDWWLSQVRAGGKVVTDQLADEQCPRRPLRDQVRRPLAPGQQAQLSRAMRSHIQQLAGWQPAAQTPDVEALRAGLWQWHDRLDESHACSQSIEGNGKHRSGDYWHAIMHRREPDYGNSKYWFRSVGSHPVYPELGRQAQPLIAATAPEWQDRLLRNGWNPLAFVDFCEACVSGQHPSWTELAEQIQEWEMLLLLAQTYQDAR